MASDLPKRPFPTAQRPFFGDCKGDPAGFARHRARPGRGAASASGAGSLVPAGRAKSAAAPRDSLPGHTELIRLQVCSLRLHASHMTSAGPPARPPAPAPAEPRPRALPGSRPAQRQPRGACRRDTVSPGTQRSRRPREERHRETRRRRGRVPRCSARCTSSAPRGVCRSRLGAKLS